MHRITKIDHLLGVLRERIFQPLNVNVPLQFRQQPNGGNTATPEDGWQEMRNDLVWGGPERRFEFAGTAVIPEAAAGHRVYLSIEAEFGRPMGRTDPQCLVWIGDRIAQGVDGNHREVLLTENAVAGERFEIFIEAETIEDRRLLGFSAALLVHDAVAEKVYYDLRVPVDVARHLPDEDTRRHLIFNCVDEALAAIDFRPGNPARFTASLAAAEAIAARVYEATDFEKKPTVVATGHTHIDVAWLWRLAATRRKMARSMATALKLMEEYPDYRFMYNQGVLLDWLEEDYPELFARLSDRVSEGRFEIEGALWLEPDANITGGESFVRHILHGVHYHEEKFGVRPRIVWLPDTFGYTAALPQLMRLSGLDVFVTHKLSWNDTNRMPYDTFHWQGIDGTRVAAYFLTTQPYDSKSIGTTYNADLKPTHVMGAWRRYGQQAVNDEIFLVYGHGDGGGGPTREMLENVRRMERGIPGCPKVRHEHMRPFFDRLLARMKAAPEDFPTWVGELYLEFHRGTLTSVAKNKRNNRLAEIALREIEALAVLANLAHGHPYPSERLHRLWRIVLLNQFHDILPGSSVGGVYEDSDRDYASFFEEAAALTAELASILAGQGENLLFNALGRPRAGLVALPGAEAKTILDGDKRLPTQTMHRADGALEQVAPVAAVPALGTRIVRVEDGGATVEGSGDLAVSERHIENAVLAVAFDEKGRITSIRDKRNGRQVLKPGERANRLQAFRDLPVAYDAWEIDPDFEDQAWEIDDLVSAQVVETGPYRAAIRFEWRYERSRIVQVAALEAGSARLDIDTFVDWHENHTLVKAAFPLDIRADAVNAEIQFGHVRRPTHRNTSWDRARFECAMHRWLDVSEPDFGAALLNDCKYGYDAKGTTLRLTLLRSPTSPWTEADQGQHRFRYALLVHHGTFAGEGVPAAAEAFNMPLRLLEGGNGSAGDPISLLEVEGEGVTVESVKKAEAGEEIVLRLWETHGRQTEAALILPAGFAEAAEVDLLERNPQALPVTDGRLRLGFTPFQIRTVRLKRG
ncbi:alpha-mannosidase [Chelativorans salis]|uniref:Glycosyl hydrolase-related protein n=1 Tax=Chelativorans salis TaxID=2978478 RepID=A0ABT2LUK9_9HYPH|nr:glycoside hydrolase family 38 C-terminal domain-containing protein [Chelativorans sp. EGI FJ00035]MCT7378204.1 glycosyl hydrolase-related protein [Chelativorans sp. EGI FJ00035]